MVSRRPYLSRGVQIEPLQEVCRNHDERDGGSEVSCNNHYEYDVHDAACSGYVNHKLVHLLVQRSSVVETYKRLHSMPQVEVSCPRAPCPDRIYLR
jgi:hypothetical protein